MNVFKKLTSHGSVSIPVAIRRELALEPKDPVELSVTDDSRILIQPYTLRCNFCKGTEGVKKFQGKGICPACIRKISRLGG